MATVLKSRQLQAGLNTAQAEVFNWEDVAGRAQDYLESVKSEARAIMDQCAKDCETLRENARREGISAGESHVERLAEQIAKQLAADKVQHAAQSIQKICNDLEEATKQWLREWQHETVAIAIGIAEKLVARQMDTDPSILLKWIEDSVRFVHSQKKIVIRLHAEDAMILANTLSEMLENALPNTEIQVVDDASVERFGAIIQTADTTIDRSLSVQMKRLEQELR
ncbi:MAG: FliH/SctL family protein [Planctomycetota bacterium]|jgi:flagellar assembly protein FliH